MSDTGSRRRPRASETARARAFDAAPVPILCLDRTGAVIDANAAAATLLGASPAELVRSTLQEIAVLDPGDREPLLAEAILSNTGWRGILRVRRPGGGLVDADAFAAPAGVDRYLLVLHDQQDRQRAEGELRRTSDRYRRLSNRSRRVREEERARLSRDLHDRLGQALSGIKMDLAWLLALCDRFEPTTAKSAIAVMMSRIDTTIGVVRRIAAELRPGVLDRLGLHAAIEWRAAEFERRSGVRCRISTSGQLPALDTLQSTELFRVFEEVLTNVGRHAHATRVRITIKQERDKFALHVYDNGRGIPLDAVDSEHSLGLIGMRERATLLGGSLTVSRGRRRGTLAVVRIPLRPRLVASAPHKDREVTEHD